MTVETDKAPSKRVNADAVLVAGARGLVNDLFEPVPAIYWTDFLCCVALGYGMFYLTHLGSLPLAIRIVAFIVSGLAIYRAAMFIHELVHVGGHELRGFRIAWNALIGIPLLLPTFLYYTHLEHHRPKHYGTHHDGEYLPLANGPTTGILLMLAGGIFVPLLPVLRFLVLTPASWVSPTLCAMIHRRLSAMIIDPSYARPLPSEKERRVWRIQEVLCLLYLLTIGALLLTHTIGWSWVIQAYLLAVFGLTINTVRTLAAHRYRHLRDEPHTIIEQLMDSINHPRHSLMTEIWAPVGLRFHALHHLLPGLPYHALPEAHRRLEAGLPVDSPYHCVSSQGLWASISQLWRDARSRKRV